MLREKRDEKRSLLSNVCCLVYFLFFILYFFYGVRRIRGKGYGEKRCWTNRKC